MGSSSFEDRKQAEELAYKLTADADLAAAFDVVNVVENSESGSSCVASFGRTKDQPVLLGDKDTIETEHVAINVGKTVKEFHILILDSDKYTLNQDEYDQIKKLLDSFIVAEPEPIAEPAEVVDVSPVVKERN